MLIWNGFRGQASLKRDEMFTLKIETRYPEEGECGLAIQPCRPSSEYLPDHVRAWLSFAPSAFAYRLDTPARQSPPDRQLPYAGAT